MRAAPARVRLETDAVPEPLTELVEHCRCGICRERLSRFEMIAIWPTGDLIVHLACSAQSKGLVANREATS
jgi:hypothetical protein